MPKMTADGRIIADVHDEIDQLNNDFCRIMGLLDSQRGHPELAIEAVARSLLRLRRIVKMLADAKEDA